MSNSYDLDFLYEVANKISARSKLGSPILPEEIFELFKETLESMIYVRIIETPVFLPFIIKKEDDFYIARCSAYRSCKGIGQNDEEAIEELKKEIELYNKASIEAEKKLRMEEMIKKICPNTSFD